MANIRNLNDTKTGQVFGEAIGAVVSYQWLRSRAPNQDLQQVPVRPQGRAGLTGTEQQRLNNDIRRSIILQLGYLTFVVPWERYKKLVSQQLGAAEASIVFGLNGYSDPHGNALRDEYTGTIVQTWINNTTQAYWFASKLRNSLAHGQVSWVTLDEVEGIELYNLSGQQEDFRIRMPVAQFVKLLVTHGLVQFVAKVTSGEHYEPLYSIISQYRLEGPIAPRP